MNRDVEIDIKFVDLAEMINNLTREIAVLKCMMVGQMVCQAQSQDDAISLITATANDFIGRTTVDQSVSDAMAANVDRMGDAAAEIVAERT